MIIFEERHSYDAKSDAVDTLIIKIEHAPKQVDALKAYLQGITTQAGVYSVDIESVKVKGKEDVKQPIQQPNTNSAGVNVWGQGQATPKVDATTNGDSNADSKLGGITGESAKT